MAKLSVGIVTAGGDAPGMNAAIRCCVRSLLAGEAKVLGIKRGYKGLIEKDFEHLTSRSVSGIINLGGTILKTARCDEIKNDWGLDVAAKNLNELSLDYLIVIGGDGTFRAAKEISRRSGVPCVGIPASIDNDIDGTEETIGFDTAVNTALDAVDKIRDTAISHERFFIVEVMGRGSGFLAITVGLASGAEFILIPEKPPNIDNIIERYRMMKSLGKTSMIAILAEGAMDGSTLVNELKKGVDAEVRFSSIGYIQRGGIPTVRSRILANLFSSKAVEMIFDGKKDFMVGIVDNRIVEKTLSGKKRVLGERELHMLNLAEKLAI